MTTPAAPAPEAKPAEGGEPKPEEKPTEKLIPQSEVTAIATREKEQGRRAAEEALAQKLGVPLEEAEQILKAHREKREAEKSEAQREKDAAAREKAAAEQEKLAAKKEAHDARVDRALVAAGLDLDDETDEGKAKVDRIRRMVTAEVGAEYDAVKADVAALKTQFPDLFGKAPDPSAPKPPKPPASDPKSATPKPPEGETAFDRGLKRAQGARSRFSYQLEDAPKK